MVYIYVLKLQENKYYVGKTNNPSFRIENHLSGDGSSWTTIYKPLKLVELVPNCDDYDEDKYTQKYMDKYGVNNVRGGSFVSIELSKEEKSIIEKKTNGSNDKCFKCGMKGHFVNKCLTTIEDMEEYNKLNDKLTRKKSKLEELQGSNLFKIKNDRISTIKEQISETESKINELENKYKTCLPTSSPNKTKTTQKNNYNNTNVCYRCGRPGHYASSCYARTNTHGEYIDDSDDDDDDDDVIDEYDDDDDVIDEYDDDDDEHNIVCYRCGRPGHYASSCYARTRVDGRIIQ